MRLILFVCFLMVDILHSLKCSFLEYHLLSLSLGNRDCEGIANGFKRDSIYYQTFSTPVM